MSKLDDLKEATGRVNGENGRKIPIYEWRGHVTAVLEYMSKNQDEIKAEVKKFRREITQERILCGTRLERTEDSLIERIEKVDKKTEENEKAIGKVFVKVAGISATVGVIVVLVLRFVTPKLFDALAILLK